MKIGCVFSDFLTNIQRLTVLITSLRVNFNKCARCTVTVQHDDGCFSWPKLLIVLNLQQSGCDEVQYTVLLL